MSRLDRKYARFYIQYLLKLRIVCEAVAAIKIVQGEGNAGTTFGVLLSTGIYRAVPPWTKSGQKMAAIYNQTSKSGAQKVYFTI